jgi:uncharacterized protein
MSTTLPIPTEENLMQRDMVDEACGRIPPLWPLDSYVAVNPFVGLSGMPFTEGARLMDRVAHGAILMDGAYYREKLKKGEIRAEDIRAVLAEQGRDAGTADPVAWLDGELRWESGTEKILTVSDWLDQTRGTAWTSFVVEEMSKWCSSYFDRGQASWSMPWRDLPLYDAWWRAASLDANPEVAGLRGFRAFVRRLPAEAEAALEVLLAELGVPEELMVDLLHRELMSVFGWSAYAAFQDWGADGRTVTRQVLAIRLAYDAALSAANPGWRCQMRVGGNAGAFTPAKYVAQLAAEHAFRSGLAARVRKAPAPAAEGRKELQAVFCIDVRSEVYRRALEAQSSAIGTAGFAGFFGMAVELDTDALCPVLLKPRHQLQEERRESTPARLGRAMGAAWDNLANSATGCFSAVEVAGSLFGLRMLRNLAGRRSAPEPVDFGWRIPLREQVDLAEGALRNMSLQADRLAPVVLLCGHGSRTENNPYGAALDCGACGGHKGDVNARFAAALFNDPDVREGLRLRGVEIPEDTVFLAGLHVTTTDDVILYGAEGISAAKRGTIEGWLRAASAQARRERARSMMADAGPLAGGQVEREVRRRSADWSEVRPEWGLAGNAAFLAARRERTVGLDLGGRAFLHEYDWRADADNSVLTLILTAPVVVASWINLQYYGSTVNNRVFGSGNKVLHNVVGRFGVWEGNGGDLRTGLPMQSLHDGEKWVHEPLRLQVFLEAPRARIDAVLQANEGVRNLVENEWIFLHAIEEETVYACRAAGDWRKVA